jgi:hypothetical protein
MTLILGAASALLLPIVVLLVVFAFSDNASDHAFRVLKPAKKPTKMNQPSDWASRRAA